MIVIARVLAGSNLNYCKDEIASLPKVARNDGDLT